jgi:hypothetical protein
LGGGALNPELGDVRTEFPRFALRIYALGIANRSDLTKEEYDALALHGEIIKKALQIEQSLGIVIDNFIEFEEALLQIALHDMYIVNDNNENMMTNSIRLNRLLMNLLASADAYIDHSAGNLEPIFSRESNKILQWHEARKSMHANSLSYRVMDALRNHALHVSLPIQDVSSSHVWVNVDNSHQDTVLSFVVAKLDLGKLSADPKFKSSVLEELKIHGEALDVAKFAREYVAALGQLHEQLRTFWADQLEIAVKDHARQVREFFIEHTLGAHPGLVACIEISEYEYESMVFMATTEIELLDYLAKKHRRFKTFSRRFVSSIPIHTLN